MKRRLLIWLGLLASTFSFIYWWENALISIPFSEALWTFYFHLTGQTNPGLASDMEFLTAIGIGLLLSYGGAKLFLLLKKTWMNKTG